MYGVPFTLPAVGRIRSTNNSEKLRRCGVWNAPIFDSGEAIGTGDRSPGAGGNRDRPVSVTVYVPEPPFRMFGFRSDLGVWTVNLEYVFEHM